MAHGNSLVWVFLVVLLVTIIRPTSSTFLVAISPQSPVVVAGSTVNLTCTTQSTYNSDYEVSWYKNHDETELQYTVHYDNGLEYYVTTIKGKKEDNGATYRCVVHDDRQQVIELGAVTLYVTYDPIFTFKTDPEVLEEGLPAKIECLVDASPPPSMIIWTREDNAVSGTRVLSFENMDRDDTGKVYTCKATFPEGRHFYHDFTLDVAYAPDVMADRPREGVNLGSDLYVVCEAEAKPRVDLIYWTKDDDPRFSNPGPVLKLRAITDSMAGNYSCKATNTIGKANRTSLAKFELQVYHKPGLALITPPKSEVVAGENITLTCEADPPGWPRTRFQWTKAHSDGRVLSFESELTISDVQSHQAGSYICKPVNLEGTGVSSTVMLTALPRPKFIPLPPTLRVAPNEADYHIACCAQGRTIEPITWFKEGTAIQSGELYEIVNETSDQKTFSTVTSRLYFRGSKRPQGKLVTFEDAGNYSCILKNEYDEMESTMELIVQDGVWTQPPFTFATNPPEIEEPTIAPLSDTQVSAEETNPTVYIILGVGMLVTVILLCISAAIYYLRKRPPTKGSSDAGFVNKMRKRFEPVYESYADLAGPKENPTESHQPEVGPLEEEPSQRLPPESNRSKTFFSAFLAELQAVLRIRSAANEAKFSSP